MPNLPPKTHKIEPTTGEILCAAEKWGHDLKKTDDWHEVDCGRCLAQLKKLERLDELRKELGIV
jgi:hypothetical protein